MVKCPNRVDPLVFLGDDTKTKEFRDGTSVVVVSVATDYGVRSASAEWSERTEWHALVNWDAASATEILALYRLVPWAGSAESVTASLLAVYLAALAGRYWWGARLSLSACTYTGLGTDRCAANSTYDGQNIITKVDAQASAQAAEIRGLRAQLDSFKWFVAAVNMAAALSPIVRSRR